MLRNLGCLLVFSLLLTLNLLSQTATQDLTAPAAAPDQAATAPIPDVPVPAVPVPTDTQRQDFHQSVQDIHFDFDRANIRPEDRTTLQSNAQWLRRARILLSPLRATLTSGETSFTTSLFRISAPRLPTMR